MDKYLFQNCQKIVIFSPDNKKTLLAQRKGEADYDGTYSFIGGKMETSDTSIIEGLRREKNEEVGEDFKIKVSPRYNILVYFSKKDGSKMILPHFYAQYVEGEPVLSDEYSRYQWVDVDKLEEFEPKINTIPSIAFDLLRIYPLFKSEDYVVI